MDILNKKKKNLNYKKIKSRVNYGILLTFVLLPCSLNLYYCYTIFITLKILALNELRGMFAIAIYDIHNRQLLN